MGVETAQTRKKSSFFFRAINTFVITIVLVIACIVAVCVWDNSRAKEGLEIFLGNMSAKNIQMDKDLLFPPLPAEDQNFAMAPALIESILEDRGSFYTLDDVERSFYEVHTPYIPGNLPFNSWRRGLKWTPDDIKQILSCGEDKKGNTYAENLAYCESEYGILLEQIRQAIKRPYCQFNVNFLMGPKFPYEHLRVLHDVVLIATARSVVHLRLKQYREATEDQLFALDIVKRIDSDNTLLSSLVQQYAFVYALQPLWEGIADHSWNKEQLEQFRNKLLEFNFIHSFAENYMFEAAWTFNYQMGRIEGIKKPDIQKFRFTKEYAKEWITYWMPYGWIKSNLVHLMEECLKYREQLFEDKEHRILPAKYSEFVDRFNTYYLSTIYPEDMLVGRYKESFFNKIIPESAARGQCFADMALIACKTELFYAAHRQYPQNLSELAKDQGDLPIDTVTGKSYHFSNNSDTFLLYSIAWDTRDNYGQIGRSRSGMEDWVWPSSGYYWANGRETTDTVLETEEILGQPSESE